MKLLDTRPTYKPFVYEQAYKYWELQQQSHWLHCVGPNEKVFTSNGIRKVIDLYNEKIPLMLFNGSEFVMSSPMLKTGHRVLYTIKTKEGYEHTVTKDHRVMTTNGWKEAQDLSHGDNLVINTEQSGFGTIEDRELAFLIGHFQGDGTKGNGCVIFNVWKHEYHIIPYIEKCIKHVYEKYGLHSERYDTPTFHGHGEVHKRCNSLKFGKMECFKKGSVPDFIWRSNKETVSNYLKGLFYTDGTVYQGKKHESIKFCQANKEFVKELQVLLLLYGIKSTIFLKKGGVSNFPDGKGGKKDYITQDAYVLEICNKKHVAILDKEIEIFKHRGKKFRGFQNNKKSHPIVTARFTELVEIGNSDVFCVSVFSENKAWVCNGFVTHNTEIAMSGDIQDWKENLTEQEKNLVGNILKGFIQSEIFIQEYWSGKVMKWFKHPEVQMMASTFGSFESIHAVAYAYLNDSLGLDDYSAFLSEPTTKDKIDRLIVTKGKTKEDIAKSLAIFSAFNEGVNLFSSFAILLNFSRFNKMKGLGQIIAFSIKDESLHADAGCWLFRTFISEYPEVFTDEFKKEIYEAARLTVQLEDAFIDKAFEMGDVEGLTKHDMKIFIRHRCNTKLQDLGLKSNWKNLDKAALQRMEWFDTLSSGVSHQDFFSGRVSDYSRGNVNFEEMW